MKAANKDKPVVIQHHDKLVVAGGPGDWSRGKPRHWTNVLIPRLAGRKQLRCLEIGAFVGRSSDWFMENIVTDPSSTLICIDTWEGSVEHIRNGLEISELEHKFRHNLKDYLCDDPKLGKLIMYKGTSLEMLKRLIRENATVDFIYVDGSHTSWDVLSDTMLGWSILKVGGVMMFDDYLWTNAPTEQERPKWAIDAFLACYEGQYTLLHKDKQVIVEKTK